MHQLVQMHGDLNLAQGFAMGIEQTKVRDHAEGVGHGDHTLLEFDPVPRHPCRAVFTGVAPERLAAAMARLVAESQHARAEVDKMKMRRRTRLPQYRRPRIHNPCRCHAGGQRRRVDDVSSVSESINVSVATVFAFAICQPCQVGVLQVMRDVRNFALE